MAHYSIAALNCIAAGENRTFFNVDLRRYDAAVSTYVLRGEVSKAGLLGPVRPSYADVNAELSAGMAENNQFPNVGLMLSSSTSAYAQSVSAFNEKSICRNAMFVSERPRTDDIKEQCGHQKNQLETAGCVIQPIYDMADVCIKSSQEKFKKSRNQAVYSPWDDARLDIYLPQAARPMQFVQTMNDSYMLTEQTQKALLTLETDLLSARAEQVGYYSFAASGSNIPTYLFQTSSSNGKYGLYDPRVRVEGIKYGYVVELDQSAQSLSSHYDNGDIFGDISYTKSMYGGSYGMEMTGEGENAVIRKCRKYVGIGASRGDKAGAQPYLKYYDCSDYAISAVAGLSGGQTASVQELESDGLVPYQKVEYFYPVAFSTDATHKSTLFSVRLKQDKIKQSEDQFDDMCASQDRPTRDAGLCGKAIIQRLKRDITAAVREIASNVCPVQTQLFDVQFEG